MQIDRREKAAAKIQPVVRGGTARLRAKRIINEKEVRRRIPYPTLGQGTSNDITPTSSFAEVPF